MGKSPDSIVNVSRQDWTLFHFIYISCAICCWVIRSGTSFTDRDPQNARRVGGISSTSFDMISAFFSSGMPRSLWRLGTLFSWWACILLWESRTSQTRHRYVAVSHTWLTPLAETAPLWFWLWDRVIYLVWPETAVPSKKGTNYILLSWLLLSYHPHSPQSH